MELGKVQTGIIGIGDMGSSFAKNLIQNGFEMSGHDLKSTRVDAFTAMGGKQCR